MTNPVGSVSGAISTTPIDTSSPGATAVSPLGHGLLPEPIHSMTMSDDAIDQIAAMLVASYRQDRKQARAAANIEDQQQAAETAKRVQEMHENAANTLKGAIAAGVSMMASGAAQGVAAWMGDGPARGTLEAGGKGAEGGGHIVEGRYKSYAQENDAIATEQEGKAAAAKRRSDQHRDEVDDAKRMLDKVADFLREVRNAQNASAAAALFKA